MKQKSLVIILGNNIIENFFILPRKISEQEKIEIISDFKSGVSIDHLSRKYKFSKITISRHLKRNIDDSVYKDLAKKNNKRRDNESNIKQKHFSEKHIGDVDKSENLSKDESFIEIAPLTYQIDDIPQKDLSSIPISDMDFPKIVYMIVNKNIELEVKYLKEYSEWQFLSQEELNRKTIQIFDDLKVAKSHCNKEQKVIKVPNTKVFKITAAFLLNKGITRIVSSDNLISL